MLRVKFGVTGGISAYKATQLIRLFTEGGCDVKVIPTANALRFIGAATLEALSHNTVDADLYTDVASVKHIQLGQEADLFVVAPASAAFLARYAAGIADDLLLNALLATTAPVLLAPAMHTEMWLHPATQENVAKLRARGVTVLEPDSGRLTGTDTGPGRLPEPEAIHEVALSLVGKQSSMVGKRILITAGGTREPIDPVRYLGNHSSGKQGIAFARAAKARGATVTLIGANIDAVSGLDEFVPVSTVADLRAAVQSRLAKSDLLVMAAAVSDFRVAHPAESKIKRGANQELELQLIANPDILAEACAQIANGNLGCLTVGFAAETAGSPQRLATLGHAKLQAKGCHYLVANDVSDGAVFDSDETAVEFISASGQSERLAGTKLQVAGSILDLIRL